MTIRISLHPRETGSPVQAHWQTYPGSFPGLEWQEEALPAGDYRLGDSLLVERKSASDFSLAIMDRRLYGEVLALRGAADQVVYVVEGDFFAGRFHSDPAVTNEAIAWMTAIEGVSLVPSYAPAFTAEILYAMARLAQQGFGQLPVLRKGKPFDPRGTQQYMVEGLPGVTPQMGVALLARFGSVAGVYAASAEELASVEGVSLALAQRIRKMLDAPWQGKGG